MNETIQTLLNHQSIRKYRHEPIPETHLSLILSAAQRASTSSNMQAYSVVRVTDAVLREQFATLSGNQRYVAECSEFLVWCADLYKLELACQIHGDTTVPTTMEHLLVATIDVALAAQNAAVAAESLGYGIVYIGGIRNDPFTAATLLALPPKTFPVFGMCIGFPAQDAAAPARPRLPLTGFVHTNQYGPAQVGQSIETYDEMIKQYMITRTGGAQTKTWSEDVEAKMKANARRHMKALLHQQGFEITE